MLACWRFTKYAHGVLLGQCRLYFSVPLDACHQRFIPTQVTHHNIRAIDTKQ
jgi:hypothetical protein